MIGLKIDDLAELLGRTREEVEAMLASQDVVELKLRDKKKNARKDEMGICEFSG